MSHPEPTGSVDAFIDQVTQARIIPVLRTDTAREAATAASRCFDAGLALVELTATTPDWPQTLRRVRADHPSRLVGVGTVLDAEQALTAADAGADFVVSPCPAPPVRAALDGKLPFIEGGLTVGEILASARHGVAKLFPAHVGGIRYLRSLLAIAPGARVVPTGGIALADVSQWLAAGASAVGVGRDLLDADDMVSAIRAALGE